MVETPSFKVLIINPNTSTHMTDALKPIVARLNYNDIHFDYFTAPSEPVTLPDGKVIDGVPSINSGEDSVKSALHCRPFVTPLIPKYDAFLVACYSAHPLVGMLKARIAELETQARQSETGALSVSGGEISSKTRKYVTGIFESSISASLTLISAFQLEGYESGRKFQAQDTFGIVTTGAVWKTELTKAVTSMLNGENVSKLFSLPSSSSSSSAPRFAGVETTGLTAIELHDTPAEEVRRRMVDATEKLLKSTSRPVRAVCLGCAGMAGMEEAVRAGCVKAYGEKDGESVHIVDGVVAGVGWLVNACKARF
ncbi:putative hydantoin racemase [Talaromyces proteolyticus]|uniref:Hydantoin racemase n=1 Tax=Talaromyces proteolyticus TaxID=1131652 RepID=A0AAD4Q1G4_9EURO|nr:putative hydantoin racemase [Talaromyces proteolyticus]KAH8698518.1 putative hydantoin racemase [Talaromyces proteolyticus]